MTMSELHALYERYFPSTPPLFAVGQGVTALRIDDDHGSTVTRPAWVRTRICPQCGKVIEWVGFSRRRFCSDACKQKAYRERKKAVK